MRVSDMKVFRSWGESNELWERSVALRVSHKQGAEETGSLGARKRDAGGDGISRIAHSQLQQQRRQLPQGQD